jgi:hypothetical protein
VVSKTFQQVIYGNGNTAESAKCDKEAAKGQNHVMKMILEGSTKDPETYRHEYYRRDPQRVQAIFRLPGTFGTPRQRQWDPVI